MDYVIDIFLYLKVEFYGKNCLYLRNIKNLLLNFIIKVFIFVECN